MMIIVRVARQVMIAPGVIPRVTGFQRAVLKPTQVRLYPYSRAAVGCDAGLMYQYPVAALAEVRCRWWRSWPDVWAVVLRRRWRGTATGPCTRCSMWSRERACSWSRTSRSSSSPDRYVRWRCGVCCTARVWLWWTPLLTKYDRLEGCSPAADDLPIWSPS